MKEHTEEFEMRIEYVRHAFKQLSNHCEHKQPTDSDCHHPDKDFDSVLCGPSNCLLLIASDGGPKIAAHRLRDEQFMAEYDFADEGDK